MSVILLLQYFTIGGISQAVNEEVLHNIFIPFGEISQIIIPRETKSDLHKRFAFIEFSLPEDAKEAVDNMNGAEIFGLPVKVNLARPMKIKETEPIDEEAVWKKSRFLSSQQSLDAAAEEEFTVETERNAIVPTGNPIVYLDVSIGNKEIGRLIFELFPAYAPKTAENFKVLCSGSHNELSYENSPLHRIIPNFMVQGGDITKGDGTGGRSIYDKGQSGKYFPDEPFILKHDKPGVLSMANKGPNTNSSQFFVTLTATPWLDGKHVVFGELKKSCLDILKTIENYGSATGKPTQPIKISACGVLSE